MKGIILSVVSLLLVVPVYVNAQAPDTLWTRIYGYDDVDEAWQLKETSDGGFIIVGFSQENDDIYLLKTDENGDTLWTSLLGFTSDDIGRSVEPLDDGGYIITGYAGGYIVLMKTDSLGNHLWHHYFDYGWGRAVRVTNDGGFVIAGYTMFGVNSEQIFIAKTDGEGNLVWSRAYGGPNAERAWDVRETPNGDFVVLGWTESFGMGRSDIYVIKTDSNGDSLWTRTYGSDGTDEGRSLLLKEDGGLIIAGKIYAPGTYVNMAIISTDSNGDTIWTKIFPEGDYQVANSITATSDGGYIFAAISSGYPDISKILKIDSNGDSLWCHTLEFPTQDLYCRSIIQSSDGGYVIAGYSGYYSSLRDVFLCKLASDIVGVNDGTIRLPDQITLHQNYPNPFNANTTISFTLLEPRNIMLSIYDLLGRKISVLADGYFDAGIHDITFDAGDLTSGIYFYNLKTGDISETKSMILLK
ncbi:MAG: T9SS type A sorting domain-containing protein [Candidatus Zixiibacteriota bacterium]|nr:MAG: T9SS type A sorting domain-containing protein [candidate division Zixibacteria bacterium]